MHSSHLKLTDFLIFCIVYMLCAMASISLVKYMAHILGITMARILVDMAQDGGHTT